MGKAFYVGRSTRTRASVPVLRTLWTFQGRGRRVPTFFFVPTHDTILVYMVTFEELVAEIRKDAPGKVMAVSYAGIKFAREVGIDCWHLAGTMCFQHVIHDHGTPEEQLRLRDLNVGYPW